MKKEEYDMCRLLKNDRRFSVPPHEETKKQKKCIPKILEIERKTVPQQACATFI